MGGKGVEWEIKPPERNHKGSGFRVTPVLNGR